MVFVQRWYARALLVLPKRRGVVPVVAQQDSISLPLFFCVWIRFVGSQFYMHLSIFLLYAGYTPDDFYNLFCRSLEHRAKYWLGTILGWQGGQTRWQMWCMSQPHNVLWCLGWAWCNMTLSISMLSNISIESRACLIPKACYHKDEYGGQLSQFPKH